MYPFRMYGRIVELYHFKVDYMENEQPTTAYFPTQEEANSTAERTSGTVSPIDAASNEWLDGIEVADVPDTYSEAVRIYEMGETAYQAELDKPTPEEEIAAIKANWNVLLGGAL